MASYRPGIDRPTTELPSMAWEYVNFVRDQIELTSVETSKTVKAVLIPDGLAIPHWVWVRVPLHAGIRRAIDVHEVDTDVWIDCGRGISPASYDRTGLVFQINRFPLDEPRDLQHSFTIVVAPQDTTGPHVHPINHLITRLVPELDAPWRGNVMVFRHSKTANHWIVNVKERNCTGIEWIISAVFRRGIVTGLTRKKKNSPHDFWLTGDLVLYLLRFLNLVQIVGFSHIDTTCQAYAKIYIRGRITRYTSVFFTKSVFTAPSESGRAVLFERFFLTLLVTKSWIVGSVALAAASTLSDPPLPNELNIITWRRHVRIWMDFLLREAEFEIFSVRWSSGPYAPAGRLVFGFRHSQIPGYCITITASADEDLGALFFASPNTDQWIAIGPHELITPVLHNVALQQHLQGWRAMLHTYPPLNPPSSHRTYREGPRFPGATTLDADTTGWTRPCGLSCPWIRRTARHLGGFAHIKWGGLDGLDEATDAALLAIGRTHRVFRLGIVCDNGLCVNSPFYSEENEASQPRVASEEC
ncbi:hypothetical protein DFH06DRAFT_1340274 [Mycena polygramma]|nr:hypothetical protein DFH06DRAFT_1340274 [Mycena polygramma]